MTNYETYESPFCTRYASEEMQFTFSAQKKFSTFRRLWVALARAEMKLGLEQVTQEKVDELEAHIDDIDFAYAAEEERSSATMLWRTFIHTESAVRRPRA